MTKALETSIKLRENLAQTCLFTDGKKVCGAEAVYLWTGKKEAIPFCKEHGDIMVGHFKHELTYLD